MGMQRLICLATSRLGRAADGYCRPQNTRPILYQLSLLIHVWVSKRLNILWG